MELTVRPNDPQEKKQALWKLAKETGQDEFIKQMTETFGKPKQITVRKK